MKVRQLLGTCAMLPYMAKTWPEDLLPICITTWFVEGTYMKREKSPDGKVIETKVPRPKEEIMALQPEYKELSIPIVLTIVGKNLNGDMYTGKRLLFDEWETASRFLLALPQSFRNYFIFVPEGRPVVLYFDLDKANDEFWNDHPNYSWDQTLGALIAVVEEAWKQLTGSNVPPPPWYEELYCFTSKGTSKVMSKHLHTTQDPESRCFFPFSWLLPCLRRIQGVK